MHKKNMESIEMGLRENWEIERKEDARTINYGLDQLVGKIENSAEKL